MLPSRIADKIEPEPNSGCWLWTAYAEKGYGRVSWNGKPRWAHRLIYELLVGPVADGLQLDHRCCNPSCVNPSHLRQVTQRDNILAPGSRAVARAHAVKTHCKHGHELTPDNLIRERKKHWRACRVCHNARSRKNYRRAK